MPLTLKEGVALFLSVRRGLESCLLNEIRRNTHLNCIDRVHFKRTELEDDFLAATTQDDGNTITQSDALDASRLKRYGEDKWLYIDPQEERPIARKSTATPHLGVKYVDKCNIRLLSGGLEVKCNREWLINSVFGLRSVESVWLRVGTPFRCHSATELVRRISALPWSQYLPTIHVDEVPLRIISRSSTVWSRVVIEESVREGIRSFLDQSEEGLIPVKVNPKEFCISVTINRNTCYVAVQCSSRLSPRLFNFVEPSSIDNLLHKRADFVPTWSLSKTRLQVLIEAQRKPEFPAGGTSNVLQSPPLVEKRPLFGSELHLKDYTESQDILLEDKDDNADALIGGLLHAGNIVNNLKKRPLKVWNPFCGNGLVISEIVSLILGLPNFTALHPPSPFFQYLAVGKKLDIYESAVGKHLEKKIEPLNNVEIIGSETSVLKLTQATHKLDGLYSFFRSFFSNEEGGSKRESLPFLFTKYRNKLPIDVSLHQTQLSAISPLMFGSMVISKVPSLKKKAGKEHAHEIIKAYKDFGSIIGSRSDWNGVFAITKGRAFERFSGLEWKCMAKATNSSGGIIRLLKWNGKLRAFTAPEERREQLDELDFF
ncbi:hypothetical protein BgAZ_208490 [Babesia gibsoni]|uniref:Uncharacterized protein n=1 Tax=Babesia gibsoni TaxID=33632 RepID=A0AAD8PEP5_BABGI|nr:hypothetical protein BgAZ_208490 [Babesia gibsoni]